MNYIYPSVPEILKGDVLLPQDALKRKHPKLYKEAIKKYKGRKHILKRKVQFLNCLWSEVLFLSPVNPKKIARALKIAGKKQTQKRKFYKINPKKLDLKKTIVYLYKYDTMTEEGRKDNFTNLRLKDIAKYDKVPNKTLKYYKEEMKAGRKPLLYHFIPHIVYKGEISVKDADIIEVDL